MSTTKNNGGLSSSGVKFNRKTKMTKSQKQIVRERENESFDQFTKGNDDWVYFNLELDPSKRGGSLLVKYSPKKKRKSINPT